MARTVDEWIAKHDDQKVPPRVRQRVFDAHGGICHLTGRKIAPGEAWELEHVRALILGGEHRESNLAPALKEAHKKKTAMEMGVKAKIARVRQKHIGVKPTKANGFPKRIGKKMDGSIYNRETGEIIQSGKLRERMD